MLAFDICIVLKHRITLNPAGDPVNTLNNNRHQRLLETLTLGWLVDIISNNLIGLVWNISVSDKSTSRSGAEHGGGWYAAGCCDQPEYISCQPLDTDRAPTSGGDEGYEESGRRADILSWAGLGIRIWGLLGILNLGAGGSEGTSSEILQICPAAVCSLCFELCSMINAVKCRSTTEDGNLRQFASEIFSSNMDLPCSSNMSKTLQIFDVTI